MYMNMRVSEFCYFPFTVLSSKFLSCVVAITRVLFETDHP